MQLYEHKLEFGWENDEGLGGRLIQQIIEGKKTATCSPLFSYTEEELTALLALKGEMMTVIDKEKRPWCNIRMIDVFQTSFGSPDPRLVSGEGNEENVKKFQQDHHESWDSWLATEGRSLTDEMTLVVELFELVEVAE